MTIKSNYSLVATSLLVLSLAACSSAPKQVDSLETTRAAVAQSSGDENLVKHAPAELSAAKDALNEADRVWKDDASVPTVEHYAQLANQKLEIAQMVADRKMAEEQLASQKAKQQEVQHSLQLRRTERAHNTAIAFNKQVSEMQGRSTHRGIVATLDDTMFQPKSAYLTTAADFKIQKIADFLRDNPQRRAIIEGHTDDAGDADFNLDLSRDRAYSLRSALINRGINASRIRALGFGGSVPLNDANTQVAAQENHRVDIIFPDTPMHLSQK
jgi:outer membrane protein OmpA-like peptidoglycan-associated protein